jgi:hypothetical protein
MNEEIICPECGEEDITDDAAAFAMLDNGSVYLVCMSCYFDLGGTGDDDRPPNHDCSDTWNFTTKKHNTVHRTSYR